MTTFVHLSYSESVDRMEQIQARMEQLNSKHRLSRAEQTEFGELGDEFSDLEDHIKRLDRTAELTRAARGGSRFALERGSAGEDAGVRPYQDQARALGGSMVVALNTDASVKRQGKGDDRPINCEADRLAVMASLGCVDLVTWFDEDTPIARILEAHPDVLVKGGDWAPEKIVGAKEVQEWGGAVHSIPFEHQRSTTALIGKIRAQ